MINKEFKSILELLQAFPDEQSCIEHLEELRWHIIRSVLAIFVLAIVAFILKGFIFDTIILKPSTPDFWTNRMFAKLADMLQSDIRINQKEVSLISIKMADQFMMHIWTSIIAGFIFASPIIIPKIIVAERLVLFQSSTMRPLKGSSKTFPAMRFSLFTKMTSPSLLYYNIKTPKIQGFWKFLSINMNFQPLLSAINPYDSAK